MTATRYKACACLWTLLALIANARGQSVDFVRDVRPILEENCYECHGPHQQKSGLRLDIKSEAFRGGDAYGPSIVANKIEHSPLLELISSSNPDERMPPEAESLSPAEIEVVKAWILQGARWPEGVDTAQLEDRTDHWSFKPIVRPPLPENRQTDWARNGIDRFVLAGLEGAELQPAPPAADTSWLRRVHFDLLGLPPSSAEVADFEQHSEAAADAQVVDALLASPAYGEHWGQHWLDVVRYADTHGFEVNTPRPNAWPYRDYVISALNQDTAYDQFILEQLTGDALQKDAATGFLVTAAALLPGQIGKDDASKRLARQDELAEIIINTSETLLGLSVGCARCHDHKFDAISQRDYYALQAMFSGVQYGERPIRSPEHDRLREQLADLRSQMSEIDRQLRELDESLDLKPSHADLNDEHFPAVVAKFVRFTIWDANQHPSLGLLEPCIDEFEIFTAGSSPRNVAQATAGTRLSASGSRHSEKHQLVHINDGRYGNSHSWMSDEAGRGWVLFELLEPLEVNRIVWSRDRQGVFDDRLPTLYSIEAGESLECMQLVCGPSAAQLAARQTLQDNRQTLAVRIAEVDPIPAAFAGIFSEPEPTHLLSRGDAEQPLEQIAPGVLSALSDVVLPMNASDLDRRRALAEWITHPNNPLTARVMVNRLWQWHFGTGLVDTPSDFGRNGARPTHPELLDWLASEFMDSGWSIKALQRLILLSATYRQSSHIHERGMARDADVRLLWCFPTRRLEAEAIRDTLLFASGRLDRAAGGPGFDLFASRGGLSGFPPIESFTGDGLRRMIYAHKIRMEREAVFGAFDCPDAGQSTARRRQSTTPIQALNLFNSRFTIEEAQAFAQRVVDEVGDNPYHQIDRVYKIALGRLPLPAERDEALTLVQAHGLSLLCRVVFNSNEFLFIP